MCKSTINLSGLWKYESEKNLKTLVYGAYLIHQDVNEVSIHGIGVSNDNFDNYGFGKIKEENNHKYIYGIWFDTPYSANPENCTPHNFKIKIINNQTLICADNNEFGYGNFKLIKSAEDLKNDLYDVMNKK